VPRGHFSPSLFNRFAHFAGPYCAPLSTGRVVLGGAELQGRRLFLSNCLRHIRHRAWVGALGLSCRFGGDEDVYRLQIAMLATWAI